MHLDLETSFHWELYILIQFLFVTSRLFDRGLSNFRVVLGDSNLKVNLDIQNNNVVQSRDIQEVIIHENYGMDRGIPLNDIGQEKTKLIENSGLLFPYHF